MAGLYADTHRELQDHFKTLKLAVRLEDGFVKADISEEKRGFIESRPLFFLPTVDQNGQPTISCKGNAQRFVKVIDKTSIAFPSYDGN